MSPKLCRKAPSFSLEDMNGTCYRLDDFDSDYLVIFFYPRDSTPGCTIEASNFSKALNSFKRLSTEIVGISGGDQSSKLKFCKKHRLKVLLLSDTDFKVSKKFGVYGDKTFMGKTFKGIKRTTFILDSKKRIIKYFDKVAPATHIDEVLNYIKSLGSAGIS